MFLKGSPDQAGGLYFERSPAMFASRVRTPTLQLTGALDQSFGPAGGANGPVHVIIRIGSDKFLIAGDFTSYGGVPRPRIARINSQGTLDTTFAPTVGPDGPVYSLLSTESGYVVGGDFERVGEAPRANLALFTTSGSLSSNLFTTGPNGPVYALEPGETGVPEMPFAG